MLKRFLIMLGIVAIMGFTTGCGEPPEDVKKQQERLEKQQEQQQGQQMYD